MAHWSCPLAPLLVVVVKCAPVVWILNVSQRLLCSTTGSQLLLVFWKVLEVEPRWKERITEGSLEACWPGPTYCLGPDGETMWPVISCPCHHASPTMGASTSFWTMKPPQKKENLSSIELPLLGYSITAATTKITDTVFTTCTRVSLSGWVPT